jgi:hypothetical protein
MHKFTVIAFGLGLELATMAGVARADDDQIPGDRGTWCSVVGADGSWAASYGPYVRDYTCSDARSRLLAVSAAAVVAQETNGLYNNNGTNTVTISCKEGVQQYSKDGIEALSLAVNEALSQNLTACLFAVTCQDCATFPYPP